MDIGIHQLLRRIVCANLLVLLVPSSAYAEEVASLDFRVRFSSEIHDRPFTGRVYLFFSKKRKEPRSGPGWFGPDPFVARDVKDWQPDEPLTFSAKKPVGMLAFPQPLAKMRLAGYRVQAVVRFNPQARRVGGGAGNGYSSAMILPTDGDQPASEPLELTVNKLIPSRKFTETKWGKQLRIHSKLLSDFHGRDVFMRAAVILPASYYDQPQRHYPTIFSIPGFGGTHFGGQARNPIKVTNRHGVEFLRVILDPSCPFGHHVFADSANNGPVGRALIEELIPAYEKTFRCVAKPTARFLTGHSSGGWSSLWLQVTYPDCFGGTWSTAPDPVDFRDFQRINIYRNGENMYVDPQGNRRPLARNKEKVLLWYKGFADMERTLGHGGQLHSFEAAFSPRGADGRPRLLWDRMTGKIDADVAKTWQAYDIRLILERNWKILAPKLNAKLHVHMGDVDTFYLDGATVLLKQSLEKLGSDAVVEIHAGKSHGSLLTKELRDRIRNEMADAYLKHHPQAAVKNDDGKAKPPVLPQKPAAKSQVK